MMQVSVKFFYQDLYNRKETFLNTVKQRSMTILNQDKPSSETWEKMAAA
jgi:hypothetical protein